ncbi:CaiB/BaiF CoA transferase family protein [Noviherbaspirillum sedimenti]|uniref:CoA transferase n=1 Tax=Noviherbaspirillum sedimenti TaxID=2320865 RepID=A0A3A3G7F5_9BURK|nr:CaiB/BaiF CoA-transferase family protein [Noviherbaspirillum sedimenti]RJG02669.1 CoA transferase [Noviherbaspirillum sedimenti]
MAGPLNGIRIVEFAGMGPGPFCAMMLSDMGAEVIRIQSKNSSSVTPVSNSKFDVMARGRRSMAIDLKKPGAADAMLQLIDRADALIEGFRPGVMERLGLGPEICCKRNSKLVFGRMTGWGQTGKLSATAGHDINYISLSGALNAMGSRGAPPAVPLNLVGDFGGGGMMLAFGVVCALLEARESGKGQVVDAAMTDGSALLSSMMFGLNEAGLWSNQRGDNLLDGAAHFYSTYECADGKCVSVGAIEPQFYKALLLGLDVSDPLFNNQMDKALWPELKSRLAKIFKTRHRDEWAAIFDGSDACVTPILDWDEAIQHEHNRDREAFVEIDGVMQPAPAPRFSRTKPEMPLVPAHASEHTSAILSEWGIDVQTVSLLREQGAI